LIYNLLFKVLLILFGSIEFTYLVDDTHMGIHLVYEICLVWILFAQCIEYLYSISYRPGEKTTAEIFLFVQSRNQLLYICLVIKYIDGNTNVASP
jgi:hypothetical protein